MSNLSELLPAGAGAKSASFVASGTLGSGVTVALNSDGTVSAVAATNVSQSLGSRTSFNTGYATAYHSAVYDSANNKIVISYQDQTTSSYGTSVVGTVSGTSISFGTPVVFESANSSYISSTFDSTNNKVVIAYTDVGNSNYGTAVVGTVSGTSISFGTPVVFQSAAAYWNSTIFDSNSNKVVVAYRGTSQYGRAIVGTVSGTSISFGTPEVFEAADTQQVSTTFDSNENKVVIAYRDGANSNRGTAIVGTVSGTTISFGSAVVFETGSTAYISSTFDSNLGKVVITYQDASNGFDGTAVVGTVSGTSISFGTPVVFETGATYYPSVSYNSASQSVVIAYQDDGNSGYGTLIEGTVSGTSITFGTPVVYTGTNPSNWMATAYDSDQKVVVAASFYAIDEVSDARVWRTAYTETNNTNFIGITDQAIADTATGAVIVKGGVSDKVTGLTTGSDYYVQSNGSLSTTVSSVPAGRALSSTSILLEG